MSPPKANLPGRSAQARQQEQRFFSFVSFSTWAKKRSKKLTLCTWENSVTRDVAGNDSEFIFGGKHGYGLLNRSTGKYRYIKEVWTDEEIADGKPNR